MLEVYVLLHEIQAHISIPLLGGLERPQRDVVPVDVVDEHYVEGGGRGPLLASSLNGDAVDLRAAEEERCQLFAVAVVVEESVEGLRVE